MWYGCAGDMNTAEIQKLNETVESLKKEVEALRANLPQDKISMVVMSGDLDKLLAAFIIAAGAAAMYEKVSMFFTFWAIPALKDPKKKVAKALIGRMFEHMLPKGAGALSLSKMNMAGVGKAMIKWLMKKHHVMNLEQLIKTAADSGVQIYVCQMSMDLMGYTMEEMIDYPGIKAAGVATFLAEAGSSKATLFI
jgi:peroxiredoxin family protein